MTSRELIRWSSRHELRARAGWWTSPWVVAGVAGGALAGFVESRASPVAASQAWLVGTLVAFAIAFMRVPFHLYWRADAALLAQLPIEGGALFDAALARCIRAAAATTLIALVGAAPLLRVHRLYLHHAAFASVLGFAAAAFLPAVATWAASLVASDRRAGTRAIQVARAIVGASPTRAIAAATTAQGPASPGTLLGALPGFAASAVIVVVLIASPWLVGEVSAMTVAPLLGGIVAASLAAIVAARAAAPRVMGRILRDVSALDRQRLAMLEIHPPTAIERAVANVVGDASLPYRKDARLMRRRYPMAYALGGLAFGVLAIVGLARPRDPAPWLGWTLAASMCYAAVLAGRLRRPPIELARLSATLPISTAARARAKLAWIVVWSTLFVVGPALFALLRARR